MYDRIITLIEKKMPTIYSNYRIKSRTPFNIPSLYVHLHIVERKITFSKIFIRIIHGRLKDLA